MEYRMGFKLFHELNVLEVNNVLYFYDVMLRVSQDCAS